MFDYLKELLRSEDCLDAQENQAGTHGHQCTLCGCSWSHNDHMQGDEAAHTCPGCGALQWTRTTEGYYGA